ncbi:cell wall synthesis protein Wag31 [Actinoplanes sichuanensis]|uniref:Cell wall synthesis protein Wag31 n=1 Tax=Actinoplanes sichuanensis TaxID=512349 RepID=A0ABW4A549_9ACTN|nr:DivIVA domain-containing protein [Actinoplanes sichuanensis]BEL03029.1 cell wall synthesis protein Wag31 [Actinoplanes sichuanensis]
MPLTPADIHNVEFRDPLPGERGYDREQVDAFLGVAERAFTRLNGQNRALRERLQQAPAETEAAGLAAELDRLRTEQARAEERARALTAELARAREAQRPAAGDPQWSGAGDDRVLAVARRHADDHLREAEEQARDLLDKARAKADQVTSDAQLLAATIDSDARHRHAVAINGLDSERDAALAEIERLGDILRDRHAGMRELIEGRLHDLG